MSARVANGSRTAADDIACRLLVCRHNVARRQVALAIGGAGLPLAAHTAQVLLCPRRHEVPVYGLWDCACGSRIEGWAFAPCVICHETAAYVPCGVCGLPVRNPFLI